MATLTTTPILTRVSTLLQDVTNIRWTKAELLTYLSDGQRELCVYKPDACVKTASMALVAGTRQTLPADGVAFVDVIRNTTGSQRAPRSVSREILDAQIPNWHSSTPAAEVLHYTFDPQNQKVIYTYPPNTGTGSLEVAYAASPVELTEGATLGVDDIWLPTLVNYVMYRCYSKDAEYAANAQLAVAYYQAFTTQVGAKTASEVAVDVNRNSAGTNPNVRG